MSDILYAAQIAQTGLRDAGQGLKALGKAKKDRLLGSQFKQDNPDASGQFLGESLRQGQIDPATAASLQDKQSRIDPMELLGTFMKKSSDRNQSPEDQLFYKQKSHEIISIMAMLSAAKNAGGGAPEVLGSDKAFVSIISQIANDKVTSGEWSSSEAKQQMATLLGGKPAAGKEDLGIPSFSVQQLASFFDYKAKPTPSPGSPSAAPQDDNIDLGLDGPQH